MKATIIGPRVAASDGGFTLVELMVGAVIAGVVLSAGFGWLWNLAALAGGVDDRAQAATLTAAVSRAVAADAQVSISAVDPPAGGDASRSLALQHDHVGVAAEAVLIVWDPARCVVWRNASGTYLGDQVTRFTLAYVLADGSLVRGVDISPADWVDVRALRVDLEVTIGTAVTSRSVEVSVGPS